MLRNILIFVLGMSAFSASVLAEHWSAKLFRAEATFECAAYAEVAMTKPPNDGFDYKKQNKRLFAAGIKVALEGATGFLKDKRPFEKKHLRAPDVIALHMKGPDANFITGRIASAVYAFHYRGIRKEARSFRWNSKAIEVAVEKFRTGNCRALR